MKKVIIALSCLVILGFFPVKAQANYHQLAIVFMEVTPTPPPTPTPRPSFYKITPYPTDDSTAEPTPEEDVPPGEDVPPEEDYTPEAETPQTDTPDAAQPDDGGGWDWLFGEVQPEDNGNIDNNSDNPTETRSNNSPSKISGQKTPHLKCMSNFWFWFLLGLVIFLFLMWLLFLLLFIIALATGGRRDDSAKKEPETPKKEEK